MTSACRAACVSARVATARRRHDQRRPDARETMFDVFEPTSMPPELDRDGLASARLAAIGAPAGGADRRPLAASTSTPPATPRVQRERPASDHRDHVLDAARETPATAPGSALHPPGLAFASPAKMCTMLHSNCCPTSDDRGRIVPRAERRRRLPRDPPTKLTRAARPLNGPHAHHLRRPDHRHRLRRRRARSSPWATARCGSRAASSAPPMTGPILCAAAHPSGDGVVTGGDDGRLIWHRRGEAGRAGAPAPRASGSTPSTPRPRAA